MAVLEQLVYGFRTDGETRRQVLGHSPGLVGDCAQEVVRLCEGWGAVPDTGLRRPVLLSFPLAARVAGMPGDLHAVIRIAPGVKPIYHALVLNRGDYLEFDLNPYVLDHHDAFLSSWREDLELARRELPCAHCGPVISPALGLQDIGSVDEAVRQMLANRRLLLPLEHSSRDSDRFLAVTIASMPRVLRQDLRFASWAPSGSNSYTLAATYRESALFSSWQPYLMTSVLDDLNPTCVQYLAELRDRLTDGDLSGLRQHSDSFGIELGRPGPSVGRRTKIVTADVKGSPATKSERPLGSIARPNRNQPEATSRGGSHALRFQGAGKPLRRAPRRFQRMQTGRVRRNLAVGVSLSILVLGAAYLWTAGLRSLRSGGDLADLSLTALSDMQQLDVALIYDRLIAPLSTAGQTGPVTLGDNRRQFGLARLSQAGELLLRQGRRYLEETDRTLIGTRPQDLLMRVDNDHEPGGTPARIDPQATGTLPAEVLIPRGTALARQLRLLPLAETSLREGVEWRDLTGLGEEQLKARFDSLLARQLARGTTGPSTGEVRRLLKDIDQRGRHLRAVDALERLMGQDHWEPGWETRMERAAGMLFGLPKGQARQLRDDALLLVRIKRAEHAAGIAQEAFFPHYGSWSVQKDEINDIMPELLARFRSDRPGGDPPALLRATGDFYTTMAWAADPEVHLERLASACRELARNRAVAFDPAVYGDHLARLRFRWMAGLLAGGAQVASLPSESYGDGAVLEHVAFLDMMAAAPDSAGWEQNARILTDPFLIRWARHNSSLAALDRDGEDQAPRH